MAPRSFKNTGSMDEEEYEELELSADEEEVMEYVFDSNSGEDQHHLHKGALGQEVSSITSKEDKERIESDLEDLREKGILKLGKQDAYRFTKKGQRAYNYMIEDDSNIDRIL
jgi:hypothetical protein